MPPLKETPSSQGGVAENPMNAVIESQLAAKSYAVVGASPKPEKYGNKIYRDLKAFGKRAFAVHPTAETIDGDRVYASIANLPENPDVVVAVVPPAVTEKLVDEMARLGLKNLWMQEGAESETAITKAEAAGIATVHGGACIMVGLRTHFHRTKE